MNLRNFNPSKIAFLVSFLCKTTCYGISRSAFFRSKTDRTLIVLMQSRDQRYFSFASQSLSKSLKSSTILRLRPVLTRRFRKHINSNKYNQFGKKCSNPDFENIEVRESINNYILFNAYNPFLTFILALVDV